MLFLWLIQGWEKGQTMPSLLVLLTPMSACISVKLKPVISKATGPAQGVQGQPPLGLMADCIWNPVKPYARVIEIDTFKAARLVAEASGLLTQFYLYLFYF